MGSLQHQSGTLKNQGKFRRGNGKRHALFNLLLAKGEKQPKMIFLGETTVEFERPRPLAHLEPPETEK